MLPLQGSAANASGSWGRCPRLLYLAPLGLFTVRQTYAPTPWGQWSHTAYATYLCQLHPHNQSNTARWPQPLASAPGADRKRGFGPGAPSIRLHQKRGRNRKEKSTQISQITLMVEKQHLTHRAWSPGFPASLHSKGVRNGAKIGKGGRRNVKRRGTCCAGAQEDVIHTLERSSAAPQSSNNKGSTNVKVLSHGAVATWRMFGLELGISLAIRAWVLGFVTRFPP